MKWYVMKVGSRYAYAWPWMSEASKQWLEAHGYIVAIGL